MSYSEIINKISNKQAKIGVIGLGYVGLPLVVAFCKAGYQVTGFDNDKDKIQKLNKHESYIKHLESSKIRDIKDSFSPTYDSELLKNMDAIIICVPTPLNKFREPDMSYVFNTTKSVAKYLNKGQIIILESTTYPGTTDTDMRRILEETGLKAGVDFYLAFSPEREDPNNKEFATSSIPKVVGGYSDKCLKIADALYSQVVNKTVPVSSTKIAEAVKLLENIYRAVNIAMVNELKLLFDKMDIDIWEVIEAAKTKPFGFQAFYPGPGLGGHCIPIDPFYLTWKAREYDFHTKFIELAGDINTAMPNYVVQKTVEALNNNGISIKDAKILILGIAYKKDIDDYRESPTLKLIEIYEEKGAKLSCYDPYIFQFISKHDNKLRKSLLSISAREIKSYDCVVLVTDHSNYDKNMFLENAKLIIDTRHYFPKDVKVIRA